MSFLAEISLYRLLRDRPESASLSAIEKARRGAESADAFIRWTPNGVVM